MASEGFSLVTSLFRAATTEGNRFTHSVDRSPEGSLISWALWCPKRRLASVRLKLHDALVPVDVNPTAPNLDRVLCQQLTDRAHELTLRVNLKELRPPQGAPLVNPSKAIGDLCRSLASQGLSLFAAAGDVNDRESITEGFLSYAVGRVARRAGLLDGPRLIQPRQISAVVCVVEQADRIARRPLYWLSIIRASSGRVTMSYSRDIPPMWYEASTSPVAWITRL